MFLFGTDEFEVLARVQGRKIAEMAIMLTFTPTLEHGFTLFQRVPLRCSIKKVTPVPDPFAREGARGWKCMGKIIN